MHEASLARDLLGRIVAVAGSDPVAVVHLTLGALCHVSPEHLSRHLTIAAAGTTVEGARLEVLRGLDPAADGALDVTLTRVDVEER